MSRSGAAYRGEFKAWTVQGFLYGKEKIPYEFLISAQISSRYNLLMSIAIFGMRVLETLFFMGLAGSAIVVLISFVEDAKELFGED